MQATRDWNALPQEDRGRTIAIPAAIALATLIPLAMMFPAFTLVGSVLLAFGGLSFRRLLAGAPVERPLYTASRPALDPDVAGESGPEKREAAA